MSAPSRVAPGAAILRLFLPFAGGYFLSYLYRAANAVIGPGLAAELSLDDAALGLLTSTYFLAFGAAQLPLGMALDRFGPRRVEAVLLLVAAAGAALFGAAENQTTLAVARALIGFGVSACLMAALKSFSQWFALLRLPSLTGWIMASGGLGALAASQPLEFVLRLTGWRQVFFGLAVLTAIVALWILRAVPDKPGAAGEPLAQQFAGVRRIFASWHFWRFAPMGFFFSGGFMAVQGLWATRWMMAIEHLERAQVAQRLFGISLAMLGGYLFVGVAATWLSRRGIKTLWLYGAGMAAGLAAFGAITFFGHVGAPAWIVFGACFSLSNISYSLVAGGFPLALAGRANTALNLLAFAGAFGLQWGIGAAVTAAGHLGLSEPAAFRLVFATLFVAMATSFLWFAVGVGRRH